MFLMCGSLRAQLIKPDVVISTNNLSLKEIYRPYVNRNPMVPSTVFQSVTLKYDIMMSTYSASLSTSSLKNFALQGIIKYDNNKEALIKNTISGTTYILRNGNIYDIKKNVLKDIKGEIRGKSVLLYNVKSKENIELFVGDYKKE
jgi:hypothetical protein